MLVVLLGAGLWIRHEADPGAPGAVVIVRLPAAGSASGVAGTLADHGVVTSSLLFDVYAKAKGAPAVAAGAYRFRRHEAFSAVLSALSSGPPTTPVTLPEGFDLAQIAARVGTIPGHSAAGFLAAARSGQVRSPYEPAGRSDLEGLLFPATYAIGLDESDTQIIRQMVDRFDEVASQLGLTQTAAKLHISPYQAVIVASIVEREAKVPPDLPKVAQVVYNRLSAGMRLQIDATVIYGLGGHITSLSSHDLAVDTPYNTYLHAGLPPTPIANPGIPSLQAALQPTPGPWLYYVVTSPDGGESFSATYAGQQANIALARSRGLG